MPILQINSDSYANLTNESIKLTCSRLIEVVMKENQLDPDDEMEDESENDAKLETMILEEFGKCLSELIDLAENLGTGTDENT